MKKSWAMLEVKDKPTSAVQPNQEYFVNHFNNMSFAAIIHPENEAEVLDALQQAFEIQGENMRSLARVITTGLTTPLTV
jgi:hypothetical protein